MVFTKGVNSVLLVDHVRTGKVFDKFGCKNRIHYFFVLRFEPKECDMTSKDASLAAAERIREATLNASKGLSRVQAERAAAAAARNVNAYGQKEEGPSRWQERKQAKTMMYQSSTEKVVKLGDRIHKGAAANPGNQMCQKCYKTGHWTFECKNERVYISRPSRSQQLKNPKLRPRHMDASELLDGDLKESDKVSKKSSKSSRKKKYESESEDDSDSSDGSGSSSEDVSESESDSDSEDRRKRKRAGKKRSVKRRRKDESSESESETESSEESETESGSESQTDSHDSDSESQTDSESGSESKSESDESPPRKRKGGGRKDKQRRKSSSKREASSTDESESEKERAKKSSRKKESTKKKSRKSDSDSEESE